MKIIEITEWEKDYQLINGDASHEGDQALRDLVAEEEDKKLYSNEPWTIGLPFECKAKNKHEALNLYNEKYCNYDYLKAIDCEIDLN